jgi:GT2 family glycosyltransferase
MVSIVVVCTNEKHHLETCLPSLQRLTYQPGEVIVVDNASDDGSAGYVAESFPSFRVVRNQANLGYASANNVGFGASRGEYLVVLNPDTEVEPEFVDALVSALEQSPAAGLATSRVCYFEDRDRINTCGNEVHVSGLGFCRGLDEPAANWAAPSSVTAASGCAFIIRRSVLDLIGGFDDDFFIYLEDTDLSIRARLAGFDVVYAPGSIAYHQYRFRPTTRKFFLLERNRWLMLQKNFRYTTLLALLPVLVLTEGLMWTYAASRGPGFLAAKARAYGWILRNLSRTRLRHREVQALRRRSDGSLMSLLKNTLPPQQVFGDHALSRPLGRFLGGIYAVCAAPARILVS